MNLPKFCDVGDMAENLKKNEEMFQEPEFSTDQEKCASELENILQ
jgi:hypothetical protein